MLISSSLAFACSDSLPILTTYRTPLPPSVTFLDDPLRVLRAVRFAARFNFKLDAVLSQAAASSEVHTALASKVSSPYNFNVPSLFHIYNIHSDIPWKAACYR